MPIFIPEKKYAYCVSSNVLMDTNQVTKAMLI